MTKGKMLTLLSAHPVQSSSRDLHIITILIIRTTKAGTITLIIF